jgi:hypothetical protein
MAERTQQPPGITQGDLGPRYTRKRLGDEVYLARYVKAGDRMRVRATLATGVIAALTTVNLTIGGRVQGMDGDLVLIGDSFSFVADGAQTAQYVIMPEGYLTHLIALTSTSGLTTGDMSVIIDLVQGNETSPSPVDLIAAGWVSATALLGLHTPQVTV